jgi:cysteine dioxygenase
MAESLPALFEACVQSYTHGSIEQIKHLVMDYNGTDWRTSYTPSDRPFIKHILFRNDAFEAILIQWKAGFATPYHAHPSNGCILKLLDGALEETVKCSFTGESSTIFTPSTISYMHDTKGLHKVNAIKDSVSLHIYAPPGFYDACCKDNSTAR